MKFVKKWLWLWRGIICGPCILLTVHSMSILDLVIDIPTAVASAVFWFGFILPGILVYLCTNARDMESIHMLTLCTYMTLLVSIILVNNISIYLHFYRMRYGYVGCGMVGLGFVALIIMAIFFAAVGSVVSYIVTYVRVCRAREREECDLHL